MPEMTPPADASTAPASDLRSADAWALALFPDPGKPGAVRAPERFLLAGMKHHFHLVEGDTLTELGFLERFESFGKLPVGR